MDIHKLLKRQLFRLGLNQEKLPNNLFQWQEFIRIISKVYNDSDDERYIMERSMELSSREIMDLNSNLESAQEIAGLGYWTHNIETGKVIWSNVLKKIFNLSNTDPAPKYEQVVEMIHPNDRAILLNAIENTINTGEKYVIEIRMQQKNGDYRWLHAVGAPIQGIKPPFKNLGGIAMDITERKENEHAIEELNQQLLRSAREVGMAEVAISIIHNIGNVLNSMNVSVNLLSETSNKSNFKHLLSTCELLQEHSNNIEEYLTKDSNGRLIPSFLLAISEPIKDEYYLICDETANLNLGIQNIRAIVDAQQSLSLASGFNELFNLKEAVELTLRMLKSQLFQNGITVIEDYQDVPMIYSDRSKVAQIILNLIKNAKEAILDSPTPNLAKQISISIKQKNNIIDLSISDDGIGIEQADLKKLFTYGYSTKKHGHGIGLHSCALCANELGASIKVFSAGRGQGSTFSLEFTLSKEAMEHKSV